MKKLLFSFIFTIAIVGFAFSQSTGDTSPVITFEKTLHDYGVVSKNSDGKCFFKFTNTGKEPLILSRPRSNCGCTVPDWPQQPIMPGQSSLITVTYDTSKPGPINKQVTIISNAANSPVVLQITGSVVE